ncbi:MAG: hypothetical protein ACRDRI_07345 [Pseudonocardiaceae bacterium]
MANWQGQPTVRWGSPYFPALGAWEIDKGVEPAWTTLRTSRNAGAVGRYAQL